MGERQELPGSAWESHTAPGAPGDAAAPPHPRGAGFGGRGYRGAHKDPSIPRDSNTDRTFPP